MPLASKALDGWIAGGLNGASQMVQGVRKDAVMICGKSGDRHQRAATAGEPSKSAPYEVRQPYALPAPSKVLDVRPEHLQLHLWRSRSFRLAEAQSTDCSCPASYRCSVSRSKSLCLAANSASRDSSTKFRRRL